MRKYAHEKYWNICENFRKNKIFQKPTTSHNKQTFMSCVNKKKKNRATPGTFTKHSRIHINLKKKANIMNENNLINVLP